MLLEAWVYACTTFEYYTRSYEAAYQCWLSEPRGYEDCVAISPPPPATCKMACGAYLAEKTKLGKAITPNVNKLGSALKSSATVIKDMCTEFGNMQTCDTCTGAGEGLGSSAMVVDLLHGWEYTCGTFERSGAAKAYKCWLELPTIGPDCYNPHG